MSRWFWPRIFLNVDLDFSLKVARQPVYLGLHIEFIVRHCGLVVSAPAWDGTGCEFDFWQCRIYIPCSLSLRLLGSLRGSYGLTQKLC